MNFDLSGRVAIVTGAGSGLGRSHAQLLARHGARVVVNDIPASIAAAEEVANTIVTEGGEAMAFAASVTDADAVSQMVGETLARWGRIDILINNAGILRDKSFTKMTLDDFRLVLDVHLIGSVICTKAVWDQMREQNYGRVVMTTSSSGLYGNFGQSNYSAAKMALVGLMQTLALEGERNGIKVNCLAPTAATAMVEGILPQEMLDLLRPELVSPALLPLVSADAPTRAILCAGAGCFERAHVSLTRGIVVEKGGDAVEEIIARWEEIGDLATAWVPANAWEQADHELKKAGYVPPADKGSI